jgi:hypothetical protein
MTAGRQDALLTLGGYKKVKALCWGVYSYLQEKVFLG